MGFELPVEIVEDNAGLDHAAPAGDIEFQQAIEILRAIDHERFIDRLPALRCSAPARENADALGPCERDSAFGLRDRARQNETERHDLVVRGVGRVTAAAKGIEVNLARYFRLQPTFEARQERDGHRHMSSNLMG